MMRMTMVLCMAWMTAALSTPAHAACPPTSPWDVQPVAGSGQRLSGIAYGDGLWVAVGASGEVMSAADGETWTDLTASPQSYDFLDIAYGDGTFMAVGSSGVVIALSGPAGGSGFSFGSSVVWAGVAYGAGVWVVVGGEFSLATGWEEVIIRSTNHGASWSEVYRAPESSALNILADVAWRAGTFVTVAGDGDVRRSTTGTGWTLATDLGASLKCVSSNDTYFFAGSTSGRIYRSTTGSSWSQFTTGSAAWFDIASGKGWVVAVGSGGAIAASSNNGSSWSAHTSGTTDALEAVSSGGSGWISVGTSNPGNQRIVSSLCVALADLAPYGALPGWSAPVEVTSATRGAPFGAGETVSIRAAWANFGAEDAGAFTCTLEVSGVGTAPINSPGLSSGFAQSVSDVEFGPLAPGLYIVTLTLDSGDAIEEENEGDNVYTLEFEVICMTACPGDTDCSGAVDFEDLNAVLLAWGTDDPDADLDDSGMVNFDDLNLVLLNWDGGC